MAVGQTLRYFKDDNHPTIVFPQTVAALKGFLR